MSALPLHGVRVGLLGGSVVVAACGRVLGDLGASVSAWAAGERSEQVVADVHIVIVDRVAADLEAAAARREGLVVVSITGFGRFGPYSEWAGSEAVHLALSGVLARSGLPDRPPLIPPAGLVENSAAVQAAWAALLAYFRSVRCGEGDRVDCSIHEMTVQSLDPGFGMGGTGAAGVAPKDLPRGRPDASHVYPIFPCADGHVRICVLAARQWRALRAWLGEPEEFADPRYDSLPARFAAVDRLHPLIGELFAGPTRGELVEEGQRRGVPIAAVLTPGEAVAAEHFAARGLRPGYVEIEGSALTDSRSADVPAASGVEPGLQRPLAGLRVLDLGVIVLGAEAGRLLADAGADVLKIENRRFPDGARQSFGAEQMGIGFAYGHRNKRGLALDLRSEQGAAIFKRLVSEADIVLSNFKPGTLESLGLGYDELAKVNPAIVVAESSAFGPTGPWSRRMGYGPLVRASTGLTSLWRYPDGEFADAMTVYPDHAAARVVAVATLALVLRRRRTGRGGFVSVSQAETILMQLCEASSSESDVYPCAGDDEWVVVTLRDEEDRRRLAGVLGASGLSEWTKLRSPREAMETLQAAGIPAGAMLRVAELPDDPHLTARGFFAELEHPHLPEPHVCERGPARFERIADPELRPAPLYGEHTREVCKEWLAMDDGEIDDLVAAGVLDESAVEVVA